MWTARSSEAHVVQSINHSGKLRYIYHRHTCLSSAQIIPMRAGNTLDTETHSKSIRSAKLHKKVASSKSPLHVAFLVVAKYLRLLAWTIGRSANEIGTFNFCLFPWNLLLECPSSCPSRYQRSSCCGLSGHLPSWDNRFGSGDRFLAARYTAGFVVSLSKAPFGVDGWNWMSYPPVLSMPYTAPIGSILSC